MRVGVVAALAAEARALGPLVRGRGGVAALADGTLVAVSGIGAAAATRAALRLLEAGAAALISWGVAGALDPTLGTGSVCLPHEVIDPEGARFATAARWRERVAAHIARERAVAGGSLLSTLEPLDTAAAKALARRRSGALAVDMESAAVAKVALQHAVPFLAVRVIVDAAEDALPRAVAAASRAGRVRLGRLLLGLLRSPADIAPLVGLARRFRRATGALAAVARLVPLAPPEAAPARGVAP